MYNAQLDNSHGASGPYNTLFRNSVGHYGIIMTSDSHQQNILGNDITDANPAHGLYILQGKDHFTLANRKAKLFGGVKILPKGANYLKDFSYYLTKLPAFWDISTPLPSIGPGSSVKFGEKMIPAKHRYTQGKNLTRGPENKVKLVP